MDSVTYYLERLAVSAAQNELQPGGFTLLIVDISKDYPELFSLLGRAMWTNHRTVILCVADIKMYGFLPLLFERALTLSRGGVIESLTGKTPDQLQQLAEMATNRFREGRAH